MKKLFVFFILLLHVNSYMFLYQGAERDCFDSKGRQYDDINSTAELIMVMLGYDKHADDEDNDTANNFLSGNPASIVLVQQDVQTLQLSELFASEKKLKFPFLHDNQWKNIYIEIATPPPNSLL